MANETPNVINTVNTYFCTDCGKKLTWDPVGDVSMLGEPCWYCTRCGWVDYTHQFPDPV